MQLGLHLPDFTWPDGPNDLGKNLTRIAQAAEDAGFAKLSVMDHVWQIGGIGPPEQEMLEAYTALGYLAACTSRIELLAWVTAVVYREPGMLAKCVTTLDVLSGGRAWLGIGAAWNADEANGLGLPFPPTAERFERLEEALQICLQMWSDDEGPYDGKHYHLARTLNSPQPLSRPHPPILIGGGGERKTLRLVARYADACNLFDLPGTGYQHDLPHKLRVLADRCQEVGRDPREIEKTTATRFDPGDGPRAAADRLVEHLAELAAVGIDHAIVSPSRAWDVETLEAVIARVADVHRIEVAAAPV